MHPPYHTSTALAGVLVAAAFASTGCTHRQHRGALLGAAAGLAIVSYASPRHDHDARKTYAPAYEDRRHAASHRRNTRYDPYCD